MELRAAGAQRVEFGLGAVALLALGHFTAFVDRAIPSVYAPSLTASFAITDTQLGVLQGPAFVAVYVIGLLIAGRRGGGLAPGPVLAGCMLVWTAATVGFAFAPNYETLVATRLVLGLGQAAFAPFALRALMAGVIAERQARAISVFTTGSATGRSGGLLIGGALLALFSAGGVAAYVGMEPWRAAVLAMAAPNLILAWLLFRRLKVSGLTVPAQGGLRLAATWIRRHPAGLGLHMTAAAFVIILTQAAAAWTPSIVNRTLGLEPAASALLVGVVVLVAAPAGHLGGGWVLDRRIAAGGGPAGVMSGGALIAAFGGLVLAFSHDPVLAMAGIGLMTLGAGAAALAGLAGLQPVCPAPLTGSVTAIFLVWVSVVGTGFGPYITGVLSDRLFPGDHGLGFALAVVMVGAAIAAALAALGAGPKWRRLADEVRGV